MRAVVVYESMYGNTRQIAESIGVGLSATSEVAILPVKDADDHALRYVDLLVLGAPTHAWGLSRASTRRGAVQAAEKPGSALQVEVGAEGPGIREWLDQLKCVPTRVAAFDTRMRAPLGLSGSAARKIGSRLRRYGFTLADDPIGFYVTRANTLEDGELLRARNWGEQLAAARVPA
jgi:hypothetical protein